MTRAPWSLSPVIVARALLVAATLIVGALIRAIYIIATGL